MMAIYVILCFSLIKPEKFSFNNNYLLELHSESVVTFWLPYGKGCDAIFIPGQLTVEEQSVQIGVYVVWEGSYSFVILWTSW